MCQKQEHCGKTSTAPSKSINVCLSSYTHIILCSLLFTVLYAAIRITGSIIYMNMIDLREVPLLLFNGLRTDISALGYIMALPVLLTFIRNIFSQKIAPYILSVERIYLMLTGTLIFFTEIHRPSPGMRSRSTQFLQPPIQSRRCMTASWIIPIRLVAMLCALQN